MPKYSLDPQHVDHGKRGITVVHEARDKKSGEYIQTDQFVIGWKILAAALKRHKTAPAKKRK